MLALMIPSERLNITSCHINQDANWNDDVDCTFIKGEFSGKQHCVDSDISNMQD